MFVSEGSSLCFLNNRALQAGGAIFASKPSLSYGFILLNRRCFIQYNGASGVDVSPDEWEVRLTLCVHGIDTDVVSIMSNMCYHISEE